MLGKISQWASLNVFMAKGKMAKEMAKALEGKTNINWNFVYENKGNYEKRGVKGQRFHVRRKMKKNNGKLKKLEA